MTAHKTPAVPVSWGELIDKITILKIKREKITAPAALANVTKELGLLSVLIDADIIHNIAVRELQNELQTVNQSLWDVEDQLRDKERAQTFDAKFIDLARSVYRLNDKRAAIKKNINLELASEIVEEKSYRDY